MVEKSANHGSNSDEPTNEFSDRQFEWVCERVAHEDNLINVRTNWTLVFHGFLFTAYTSGIGLYEKLRFVAGHFDPILTGVLVICGLGFLSAIAAYVGVAAAEVQLRKVTDWWSQISRGPDQKKYPPVFIHSESKAPFGASMYFLLLAVAWIVLGAILRFSPQLTLSAGGH